MMNTQELLQILACPRCMGSLEPLPSAEHPEGLACPACNVVYPVRDDIPIMLVDAAVERARAGEGPTMIECKTYRIEGHFVGDPELYRSKEETMKIFHDTDPLKKFREKMAESMNNLVTSAECDEIDAKVDAKIKAAKEFAMDSKQPDASEYMKFVYAD